MVFLVKKHALQSTSKKNNTIELFLEDNRFSDYVKTDDLLIICFDVFDYFCENCSLSLMLSDDAYLLDLNSRYRHINKPTNVLSFPSGDVSGYIGDIAIAFETVMKESIDQKKKFHHHISHLAVHGILHLLGYDHQDDTEAQEMEQLEVMFLKIHGIASPYI